MTDEAVRTWIDAYVKAWNSNDPAQIGALFTDEAEYYTAPFRTPWRGRQGIIDGWLERKDEPGETTETFSNLWVIRLDPDGRAHHFTEWWMEHSQVSDS